MKIIISIFIIIVLIILALSIKKIFFGNKIYVKDQISQDDIVKIESSNYTNILKAVHEDLDSYVGIKIQFTGYVYKVLDLEDNEFVLARDMIISSDYQAVVVGFLCKYDNATDLKENSWINITGEITKGNYHNEEIPIIKITNLESTTCPNDEFVYPPDSTYVLTSNML